MKPAVGSMTNSEKRTIALVISSGWGVRTFLQTEILPRLQAEVSVVIFASPELIPSLKQRVGPEAMIEPLQPFDHSQGEYGRFYGRRNYYFTELNRTRARSAKLRQYRRSLRGRKRDLIRSYLLAAEAKLLANESSLRSLFRLELKAFYRDYPHLDFYRNILESFKPDLILATVPHVSLEAPPLLVARQLGIKTACWINSWDNLTTKSAYFAEYDHYFVWSEHMRGELLRYYSEVGDHPITATGVPHFDWYQSAELMLSREEFCRRSGLDPARPIILYAMATPYLAPAEDLVVKELAMDLPANAARVKSQLIVRVHPADNGERLQGYEFDSSVRVQVPGKAGGGNIFKYHPSHEDNREFVNSIRHADVVVNLASTITLDACLCDRPVISVAFDPSPDRRYQTAIDHYHTRYEHYQTALQCGAVRLAHSHHELLSHIRTYLDHPELEREGRRSLAELWCGPCDGAAASRLARALLKATPGLEAAAEKDCGLVEACSN